VHHGFQIVNRADALIGCLVFCFKKNFINIPLDGGRAVNGAERYTQLAGGYKILRQARLLKDFLGDLAGVIGDRPHCLAVRPFEIVFNGIIHCSVNAGMNKTTD